MSRAWSVEEEEEEERMVVGVRVRLLRVEAVVTRGEVVRAEEKKSREGVEGSEAASRCREMREEERGEDTVEVEGRAGDRCAWERELPRGWDRGTRIAPASTEPL